MPAPELDETLEIFGQQNVRVTTPFLYCYPLPGSSDLAPVITALETGLQRLTADFPWVAGKVVNEGKTDVNSGVFKIKPGGDTPPLFVKHYRENTETPSMQALQSAAFPVSMLSELLFSPIKVLPTNPDQDRSPVLVLQATRIRGGLLLNIVGNHQALDGTGQEQVSYLLDKACRGIPFSEEEVRIGNLPRSTIVKPFDDSWQPSESSRYLKSRHAIATNVDSPPSQWATVLFPGAALAKLKGKTTDEVTSGYVSTDDALTALIWKSPARARLARLPASRESTLGRAINPRRYLGIPATYPGYIFNMAYTSHALGRLDTLSLGAIASDLRMAVDPQTSGLNRTTREFATLLYRADDKDSVSAHEGLELGADIMLSSWANMRCYDFDFGMQLGLPIAFRRTLMDPVPSLIFLLPKRKDGEIVVTLCVLEEDLVRLRTNEFFTHYGQFLE